MQVFINESNTHTVNIHVKKLLMPCVIICFAILILLRDLVGINISRYVFIGLATLTFIFSDKQNIYVFVAFLTPLSVGISATYITVIALVIIFIKQKELKVHVLGLACMVLILLMELLSSIRGLFSLVEYLRFVGIFAFAFLCMIDKEKSYDYERMLKFYIIGFFVAMASVIGQMLNEYSISEFLSLGIRLGNTKTLLGKSTEGILVSYNANELGALCLLTINICLLLHVRTRNKFYMITFIIASLLGLMTQSRAFLLCYVASVLLYIFMASSSVLSMFKYLGLLVLGALSIVGLTYWLIPDYMDSLIERFQVADVSGGRNEILAYYFSKMFLSIDRVLIGVGLQNYTDKYDYYFAAHNATQEVMIAWGICGLIVVVLLFIIIFRNAKKQNPSAKAIQFIPLIMSLVMMQSLQGFSDRSSMLRLMIAYVAILMSVESKPKKVNVKM